MSALDAKSVQCQPAAPAGSFGPSGVGKSENFVVETTTKELGCRGFELALRAISPFWKTSKVSYLLSTLPIRGPEMVRR